MGKTKIGDKITALIKDIDDKGRGTLVVEGKEALANFVIPGEEINGTVTARTKGVLRIKADEIVKSSVDRVVPRCQYAGHCGGCPWQHISYERQCELKLELVNNALAAEGLTTSYNLQATTLVRASEQFYHRNRMDYVFGRNGELGLKEPEHWDKVIDLDECFMLSPEANKVMQTVRDWMKQHRIEPWDNRQHTGLLRYTVIREGKNTNERLVMIVTSAIDALPHEAELVNALKPLVTSLIHGINPEITDLSIPKTTRTLFGNGYLTEKVNGLIYQIPPASFFQTNTAMAAVLQDIVVEFAAPKSNEVVIDLYCGNGFLTLALAKRAKTLIGVEIDEAAVMNARVNAELNDVRNAIFSVGATESLLPITLSRDNPDCIALDPPRSGLHPKALSALMEFKAKRMVYVSCNPLALARDLKILLTVYEVADIRCIDLFPHTPHIETIVALTRKQ